jgi:hypothetical protein
VGVVAGVMNNDQREFQLARLRVLLGQAHSIRTETTATVKAAREWGASWAEIGDALGISQQGAQQRYRFLSPDLPER